MPGKITAKQQQILDYIKEEILVITDSQENIDFKKIKIDAKLNKKESKILT